MVASRCAPFRTRESAGRQLGTPALAPRGADRARSLHTRFVCRERQARCRDSCACHRAPPQGAQFVEERQSRRARSRGRPSWCSTPQTRLPRGRTERRTANRPQAPSRCAWPAGWADAAPRAVQLHICVTLPEVARGSRASFRWCLHYALRRNQLPGGRVDRRDGVGVACRVGVGVGDAVAVGITVGVGVGLGGGLSPREKKVKVPRTSAAKDAPSAPIARRVRCRPAPCVRSLCSAIPKPASGAGGRFGGLRRSVIPDRPLRAIKETV